MTLSLDLRLVHDPQKRSSSHLPITKTVCLICTGMVWSHTLTAHLPPYSKVADHNNLTICIPVIPTENP